MDKEIRDFLEEKASFYNRPGFIVTDPVSVPHRFERKEDIEISGFLTATIAWGQRTTIIRNAGRLMQLMDEEPYLFILNADDTDRDIFSGFSHRTLNAVDCRYFLSSLKNIYLNHGGLEQAFDAGPGSTILDRITRFRALFFELPHPMRTRKHIADPASGASAKRLNMFLRWMVRNDGRGVDFGFWKSISPADLLCPLDVHSGSVARKLGLLQRKQNDWKAVCELTASLKMMDPHDPVKYDFALFGLGVFEKF